MTSSKASSRDFAMTSFSCSCPTAANTGLLGWDAAAGVALRAATQIEQVAESVRLGWLWRDSAATVHNITHRHNHADQRRTERIGSYTAIRCIEGITVAPGKAMPETLL
jgi:hypothetical protein